MKFNMVCIKFDQKIKNLKNLKPKLFRFLGFFKKPKKTLGFFRSHFPALVRLFELHRIHVHVLVLAYIERLRTSTDGKTSDLAHKDLFRVRLPFSLKR